MPQAEFATSVSSLLEEGVEVVEDADGVGDDALCLRFPTQADAQIRGVLLMIHSAEPISGELVQVRTIPSSLCLPSTNYCTAVDS